LQPLTGVGQKNLSSEQAVISRTFLLLAENHLLAMEPVIGLPGD
jgi:hypothetical protein